MFIIDRWVITLDSLEKAVEGYSSPRRYRDCWLHLNYYVNMRLNSRRNPATDHTAG
jgi:hypothetical protein